MRLPCRLDRWLARSHSRTAMIEHTQAAWLPNSDRVSLRSSVDKRNDRSQKEAAVTEVPMKAQAPPSSGAKPANDKPAVLSWLWTIVVNIVPFVVIAGLIFFSITVGRSARAAAVRRHGLGTSARRRPGRGARVTLEPSQVVR